jgi:hypothetical protein
VPAAPTAPKSSTAAARPDKPRVPPRPYLATVANRSRTTAAVISPKRSPRRPGAPGRAAHHGDLSPARRRRSNGKLSEACPLRRATPGPARPARPR